MGRPEVLTGEPFPTAGNGCSSGGGSFVEGVVIAEPDRFEAQKFLRMISDGAAGKTHQLSKPTKSEHSYSYRCLVLF
jgi:hypothetical protein